MASSDWLYDELMEISPDNDNWNTRYQEILAKPENTPKEKLEKYTLLYGLNKDFVTSATSYAKTIISEYFLDDPQKSIHLQEIGGHAGGKKFLWRGILFKLAYGDLGPYTGNDEAAARAMGNELKGGNSYFRCAIPGLNVALQALIDYKGFRMHAQVLLPINRDTLKVGTADAGKDVRADSEELISMMEQAATELNIRKHVVKDKVLFSGCDVEGHLGTDGNFYLVDLSRTFPPESPLFARHLCSENGVSPGTSFNLSLSSNSPYLPGDSRYRLNGDEVVTAQGYLYSYHSDDDSYEIRVKFPEDISTAYCTLRLSSQDLKMSSYPFPSISAQEQHRGLSIYWRQFRPEFVKHRGSQILSSLSELCRHSHLHDENHPVSFPSFQYEDPPPISENRENSKDSSGYSEGFYLGPAPDIMKLMKSFSSPDATSTTVPSHLSRQVTFSVGDAKDYFPRTLDDSDEIVNEDLLDDLPPAPTLFRRESSGPMYHTMPDPEVFSLSSRPKSYSEDDILSTGCALERQFSEINISPNRHIQDQRWSQFVAPQLFQSVTSSDVFRQFELITGKPYSSTAIYPSPPLSADALSSFSRNDPESAIRNQEIHTATIFLVTVVIPSLALDLMARGHPMEREGLTITEYMHKHGVNIRHAGLLRHLLLVAAPSNKFEVANNYEDIRLELLNEIVSRTLKNILRETQRFWMSKLKTTSEHGMLQLIVRFFNLITGYHRNSSNFWNEIVIPGMITRFGRVSLTDQEMGYLEVNDRKTFNMEFSDLQLKRIILMVANATGVIFSNECLQQLDTSRTTSFEFTISDLAEIKPVVKHMHQMDFAEGLMLSLKGQEKENHNENYGVIVRLMRLATNKLHAALKAVPDDVITKYALADAYQTLAFAEWQKNTALSDSFDPSNTSQHQDVNKGFELYRSLICDEAHTRCSKLKLSYREDILGICIVLKHFEKNTKDTNHLSYVRIRDVTVYLQCISLTYFRKYLRSINGNIMKKDILHDTEQKELICGVKNYSRGKRRFFPLIVNEEHAERAYELLCEEIVRSDQLIDQEYESPIEMNSEFFIKSGQTISLPSFNCCIALRVISAVMNSMVVMFSLDADKGKLSDPALVGFSRFHHMLLYLAKKHPEMITEANNYIEKFVSHRLCRNKVDTPDLGRLLVYLLLSDRGWDAQFRDAYLEEALSRQVSWFTKDHKHPELLILETDRVAFYRLKTTFEATLSSIRTVMFQIYFLQSIARKFVIHSEPKMVASGNRRNDQVVLQLYNASLGRPTAAMRSNYHQEFENIVNVSNYKEFLDRLGCNYSPEQMTVLLRNAVRAACAKRYGGLRLMDIIGDSHVEHLPENSSVTWDEVSRHSKKATFDAERAANRQIWLDRQKELRRQAKARESGNPSFDQVEKPNSNQRHQTRLKKDYDKKNESSDTNKNNSWVTSKDWGRKSRKSDSFTPDSNYGTAKSRSEADSNWRKR